MSRKTEVFAALAREEIQAARKRLSAEAGLRLAIALFLALALGFAVALGLVALIQALGALAALAIATGASLLLALIAWGLLARQRRRAEEARVRRRANQARALRLALVETFPILRNGPLLALLAALISALTKGRTPGSEEDGSGAEDGTQPTSPET